MFTNPFRVSTAIDDGSDDDIIAFHGVVNGIWKHLTQQSVIIFKNHTVDTSGYFETFYIFL